MSASALRYQRRPQVLSLAVRTDAATAFTGMRRSDGFIRLASRGLGLTLAEIRQLLADSLPSPEPSGTASGTWWPTRSPGRSSESPTSWLLTAGSSRFMCACSACLPQSAGTSAGGYVVASQRRPRPSTELAGGSGRRRGSMSSRGIRGRRTMASRLIALRRRTRHARKLGVGLQLLCGSQHALGAVGEVVERVRARRVLHHCMSS